MKKAILRTFGILIVISSCMISCVHQNKSENDIAKCPAMTEPDRPLFEEPTGPLPPLKEVSAFLYELGDDEYMAVEGPAEAVLFRWNFSVKTVYSYDYRQKVLSEMSMMNDEKMSSTIDGNGAMLVKSKGGGLADVVIKDMVMETEINGLGDAGTRKMNERMPLTVLQDMKEDGSIKSPAPVSVIALHLDYLFPLPSEPLMPGQSAAKPLEAPFNAMGSLLYAKGSALTTFKDYVMIGDRLCARLVTEIDVSKMDVPEELEGTYLMAIKGRSIFYFDIAERSFVKGKVALVMSIRADMPGPKMSFPEGEEPAGPDFPETMRMVMDSDNLITLERASVE